MRTAALLTGSALALIGSASFTSSALACELGVPNTTATFTEGANDCYEVPAGVESLQVVVVGAPGGNAGTRGARWAVGDPGRGGSGAVVQATVDVSGGQVLNLSVGNRGYDTFDSFIPTGGGELSQFGSVIFAGGGGGGGGNVRDNYYGFLSGGGDGGSAGATPGSGSDGLEPALGAGRGGRYGTFNSGGTGGAAGGSGNSLCISFPVMGGSDGTSGYGGYGSTAFGTTNTAGAGGNGGLGYFGGGGGGVGVPQDCSMNSRAGGGGGGAGSSYIDGSVARGSISTDGSAVPQILVTAGGLAGVTTSVPSLDFATTQAQGTLSAPQTVTLTSTGDVPLRIDGLTVGGANPEDFLVSGDTCRRAMPAGKTCQVSVRFAPQTTGAREATLVVAGNTGASVALTGTGGALPTGIQGIQGVQGTQGIQGTQGLVGPQGGTGSAGLTGSAGAKGDTGGTGSMGAKGDTGATGSTGARGDTGAPGRDGVDASTSCLILTAKTTDDKDATGVLCTVTSVAKKAGAKAKLTRAGKTYATGTETKGSKLTLRLRKGMRLTAGTYTLTRTYRQSNRTVTEQRKVRVR